MKRLLLILGFIPIVTFSQNVLFSENFDFITPNFQNPGNEIINQTGLESAINWQWNVPSPLGSSPLSRSSLRPGRGSLFIF